VFSASEEYTHKEKHAGSQFQRSYENLFRRIKERAPQTTREKQDAKQHGERDVPVLDEQTLAKFLDT
jgi:hypothetical protein